MKSGTDWNRERAMEIIKAHRNLDGAALPILHALQHEFGYVDGKAVPLIAEALNLSRAEMHGIVSFYHDFRGTAPDVHVLKRAHARRPDGKVVGGLNRVRLGALLDQARRP